MENQNYNANYARYRKIEKTVNMANSASILKIASILIALVAWLSIFIGALVAFELLSTELMKIINVVLKRFGSVGSEDTFLGYPESRYAFFVLLWVWLGFFSIAAILAFAAFILHYKVNAEYKEYSKKNELTSILLFHGFFLKVIAIQALFRVVAQFKALLPKDPYMSANPNVQGNSSSDNAQSFQKEYTSQKVNSYSSNINLTQKQGNLPALAIATGILKILYVILRITKFFVKYGSITKFLRSLSYGGIMGLFNGGLSGLLIGSIGAKLIQFILVGLWLVIFIMQIVAVVRYSKIE